MFQNVLEQNCSFFYRGYKMKLIYHVDCVIFHDLLTYLDCMNLFAIKDYI